VAVLRVLIADLPDLQADVVAKLVAAEADMVVVGRGISLTGSLTLVETLAPDVILVAAPLTEEKTAALQSLGGHPEVSVLAIDGATGTITRVTVFRDGGRWPSELIAAIRTAGPSHEARHRLDTRSRQRRVEKADEDRS
jgi:hypothetical protein